MKKNISHIILLFVIAGFGWVACDKIDEPIELVGTQDIPENIDDTIFFIDSVLITSKHVLLEDFTGHKCVNCPEAAQWAHEKAEAENHKLIIYSVHAGHFAKPDPSGPFATDLRSVPGEELYTNFEAYSNPCALIDREEYNSNRVVIFSTGWETPINEELAKPNVADLKIRNTYYPKRASVMIDIEATILAQLEGKYKLCVYIVEDSIVSPQLNNDENIGPDTLWNWTHRNVLRDAINTTYGELISETGEVVQGITYQKQYFYEIPEAWVTRRCNIIAYLGKSDETLNLVDVIQVAELGIKTED
nr:Omp28-related outer membrane protein [Bacteroidota bacterium]